MRMNARQECLYCGYDIGPKLLDIAAYLNQEKSFWENEFDITLTCDNCFGEQDITILLD